MMRARLAVGLVSVLALGAGIAALGGCAGGGGLGGLVGGGLAMESTVADARLGLGLPTRVYRPSDAGLADFYLTDLPEATLRAGGDLSQASGTVVHVHLFVEPEAGRTPLASTATSATVRVLVLANGQAGIYAGGGFARGDREDVGDARLSVGLRGTTMRLQRATPGFSDLLGPSVMGGVIDARRDEAASAALAEVFRVVGERLTAER